MTRVAAISGPAGRRPLLSFVVLGTAVLIAASVAVPQLQRPFGDAGYGMGLCGVTMSLGVAARLRGERGAIAAVALVCAGLAAALLVLLFVFAFGYGLAVGLAMPS